MSGTRIAALAVVLVLGGGGTAVAQFDRSDIHRPFEFDVLAGAHKFEDSDETGLGVGARLLANHRSGFSFGGSFDWVIRTEEVLAGEQDVTVYYYNAELEYTFPTGMIEPFLGAGAGAATVKLGDVEGSGTLQLASTGSTSETYLMVPVAAGIKIYNTTRRIGGRIEVRDNVVFVSGDADAGTEDDTTHGWAIGAGVSFQFGGP